MQSLSRWYASPSEHLPGSSKLMCSNQCKDHSSSVLLSLNVVSGYRSHMLDNRYCKCRSHSCWWPLFYMPLSIAGSVPSRLVRSDSTSLCRLQFYRQLVHGMRRNHTFHFDQFVDHYISNLKLTIRTEIQWPFQMHFLVLGIQIQRILKKLERGILTIIPLRLTILSSQLSYCVREWPELAEGQSDQRNSHQRYRNLDPYTLGTSLTNSQKNA